MANFGISEKIEKIETFISENLKIFGYDLNFLTQTPLPHDSSKCDHVVLSRYGLKFKSDYGKTVTRYKLKSDY